MAKNYRCAKIKAGGTIYGFHIPINLSNDLMDIVTKGDLKVIRVGMMNATDPKGNPLGKKISTWNCMKFTHEIEKADKELYAALVEASKRAVRKADAEEKYASEVNEVKLPQLISKVIGGKPILTDITVPCYFINSVVYCANCKKEIKGTQVVHVNKYGKVESTDKFVPSEPAVPYKENSHKWLHPECTATSILTTEDVVGALEEQTEGILKKQEEEDSRIKILLTILEDVDTYTSDFARGAAYFYLKTGGHKDVSR